MFLKLAGGLEVDYLAFTFLVVRALFRVGPFSAGAGSLLMAEFLPSY